MNKTIIVIGSVTAEQYKPVRLECLAEGNKPRIVRVTIEELFSNEEDLVRNYGVDGRVLEYWSHEFHEVYDPASDEGEGQTTFRKLAAKHLAQYGDIEAVLMDEPAWDEWSTMHEVAGEVLKERDIFRWVVIDGRTEFIG